MVQAACVTHPVEILVFGLGGCRFGVDIGEVDEILNESEHNGDNVFAGQGMGSIKLFDLSSIFGVTPAGPPSQGPDKKILLSRFGGKTYALRVTRLYGIERVEVGEVHSFPEPIRQLIQSPVPLGVWSSEQHLTILIGLQELIRENR